MEEHFLFSERENKLDHWTHEVNVPCNIMLNAVTVKCGHCSNLLSLNIGTLLQTPTTSTTNHHHLQNVHTQSLFYQDLNEDSQSSKCNRVSVSNSSGNEQSKTLSVNAMGKRQRAPSAYNRFIKEEIRRIKINNPKISHREAFSTAAKNWAHLPQTHCGLTLNGSMKDMQGQRT